MKRRGMGSRSPIGTLAGRQCDVGLSFLPLSHAFERMVVWVYLLCGVHVVYAESFDTIGRDTERDFFMGAEDAVKYGIVDKTLVSREAG